MVFSRAKARVLKHNKIRKKMKGSSERLRLSVFRSSKHIYAQIINDYEQRTLVSVSTLSPDIKKQIQRGSNTESAKLVGQLIAQKALELNIKKIVFDRGGFPYHGRIKALADAAREKGLDF